MSQPSFPALNYSVMVYGNDNSYQCFTRQSCLITKFCYVRMRPSLQSVKRDILIHSFIHSSGRYEVTGTLTDNGKSKAGNTDPTREGLLVGREL